ncbi:MAG: hypothetical protein K2X93_02840 [Candidatus Obscuribacterales bacterium]|nr:hypothetical protein [Candidatus Obscuribacterales bacterium]
MRWSLAIALSVAILGFIPLMGLPGAVVLTLGEFSAGLLGFHLLCLKGDRAWPAAILATWTWPIFIPIAYFLVFKVTKISSKPVQWIMFFLFLYAGVLLVTAGIEWMARSGA